MKYTTIIGILLIAIGLVASFIGKIQFGDLFQEPEFALGLLYGGGAGFLLGGLIGWMYKKRNKTQTVIHRKVEEPTPPTGSHNL